MLIVDDVHEEILRNHVLFSKSYLLPIENAEHRAQGANLACGDDITIGIHNNNQKIQEIGFEGNCCDVAKTSASLMIQELKGKTKNEAVKLHDYVEEILTTNTQDNGLYQVLIMQLGQVPAGSKHYQSAKCALLPWEVMLRALRADPIVNNSSVKKDFSLFLE